AEILVFRPGERHVPLVAAIHSRRGEIAVEDDQAARVAYRKVAEQELIEEGEQERVDADAKRQRGDGNGREARAASETARGRAEAVPGAVEIAGDARFACIVFDLFHAAELQANAAARFFEAETALDVILNQAFLVEAQLGVHFTLDGGTA